MNLFRLLRSTTQRILNHQHKLAFISSLIPGFYLFYQFIQAQWKNCTENWLLGWDPSARFSISMEIADNLRQGNFWKPILIFLHSPTWPSLRSFIESFVILGKGADSNISLYITLATFLALIILSHWILYKSIKSTILLFLFAVCFDWMLFETIPILVYAYSGMLEIQGAVFFLLSVEAVFLVQKDSSWKTRNLIFLSIASLLLLFTKYPYALQFLFSLFIFFVFLNFSKSKQLLKNYLYWFGVKGNRRILLPFLIILFSILLLGKIGSITISNKLQIQLIEIFFLFFLLDINHFLSIESKTSVNLQFSKQLRPLWFFVFLPSLVWISIHPDRFASLFPTLKLEQGENNLLPYLYSFYKDIPIHFSIFLLVFLYLIYQMLFRSQRIQKSRFFIYASLGFLVILGQKIITSNQQARHIYHIYPVILISILFLFYEIYLWLSACKIYNLTNFFSKIPQKLHFPFLQIVLISLLSLGILSKSSYFLPKGNINSCYVIKKYDVSAIPLWIKSIQSDFVSDKTILINDLAKNHINRPDTQLVIEESAYNNKMSISVNPKSLDTKDYDYLLRISSQCSQQETQKWMNSKTENEISLTLLKKEDFNSLQEGLSACIEKYKWKRVD
ncbi:MAG: hypothetical protein GW938_15805 [Leptospira sp.]|nr:hypothetical protein [Leptospira sp.]